MRYFLLALVLIVGIVEAQEKVATTALQKTFTTSLKVDGKAVTASYIKVSTMWLSGGISPIYGPVPMSAEIVVNVYQSKEAADSGAEPLISNKIYRLTLNEAMLAAIVPDDMTATAYALLKFVPELSGAVDLP